MIDSTKQTLLHSAVDSKNISAIQSLSSLNLINDINSQDDYGMTALHIACINFDIECFTYIFNLNPNFQLEDKDGYTAKFYIEDNEEIPSEIKTKLVELLK